MECWSLTWREVSESGSLFNYFSFVGYHYKNDRARFPKTVLPEWLQKCFRTIHLWPAVELMCQKPLPWWHTRQRPGLTLNCAVMRSHRCGTRSIVTGPRTDVVLPPTQKQSKYIFRKSFQRSQQSLPRVYFSLMKSHLNILSLMIFHNTLKGKLFYCLYWRLGRRFILTRSLLSFHPNS